MSAVTRLAERLEKWTGIAMDRAGLACTLERYVEKRVPELGFSCLADYVESVTEDASELRALIGALTVPHSWFFRDAEQWQIVESLIDRVARTEPVVRAWVPGCATGEDAYTLAMIALRRGVKVEVVASDINAAVLPSARRGVYNAWAVREIPAAYRDFVRQRGRDAFEVDESIRHAVTFLQHNLVHPPLAPSAGHWDLVVCRNVFIYLERSHAAAALRRLGQALRLGGWLILGASDLVYSLPPDLVADYEKGRLVFRRADVRIRRPSVRPLVNAAARQIVTVGQPPAIARAKSLAPPDHAVSLLMKQGNEKLDAGHWTHAIELYEKAQRLDPLAPEPYFFAGVAHHKEGQLDHAVQRLRSSLFLQPTLWPASLYLALCYERMQRTEEASLEYRRVVEAGDTPLRLRNESAIAHDLESWRREVVTLARRRARRKVP